MSDCIVPILKFGWQRETHLDERSKCRSQMELTLEMISAPLGNFHHTMYVGESGDAFGNTYFLGIQMGEPLMDGGMQLRSLKLSLLFRTFRISLVPTGSSPSLMKSAMSLPYLNDRNRGRGDTPVTHSLSSSPLKQQDSGAANGATAAGVSQDPELDEKHFGELTELPSTPIRSAGLKHAVSVLSFYVDLGPSMLGDILGVMEREEDDLGYEEGGNSEDRGSPFRGPRPPPSTEDLASEGGEDSLLTEKQYKQQAILQ
uniref:CDC42 effector protein (Rho GTPase binding) 4a n=1 Tax=Paramormyrops kingsleyae TaxID=1676925 RepID=A0A3B3TEY1_9TELE